MVIFGNQKSLNYSMICFKKINVILFSTGIIFNSNSALANTIVENYKAGLITGSVVTTCQFYQRNMVSENNARKVIEANFKLLKNWNLDKTLEEEIYEVFDTKENNRICKKFIP